MSEITPLLNHLSKIKIPGPQQKIYKDECVFSFDDPETDTGLYVSLTSFLGFGRQYVEQYYQHSNNPVFLHIQREKKLISPVEQKGDGPEKKITRLAIGVEGGFDIDTPKKYEVTDHLSIVILPGFITYPWPNESLPEVVIKSVEAIMVAESPLRLAEMESMAGTWDGEVRKVSVHATNLEQLNNGVKIPPTGWKCQKCDLTQNLWLNLTDGSILCGRKFFDGSGGNDHAVQHYAQTMYPLAVKLGTITPDGKGDVFSYAEDDMVEDPNLVDHLKHFGINTQNLQKTEKSMVELELEVNQRAWEWGALQESSSSLQPAQGPGLTGLINLGNSCYLNSVMQIMFTIPSFIKRFVEEAPAIFSAFPSDPVNDFNIQVAKLGVGLLSGKYSTLTDDGSQKGVSPTMFKCLIGKGHPEFSTKRQQDAQEFYMHFLDILQRHSRHTHNPSSVLKLNIEERVACGETGQVSYSQRSEYSLALPVPLGAASNREQVEAYEQERRRIEDMGQRMDPSLLVRPQIPFKACIDAFAQEEIVEQFFSTAVNRRVTAKKSTKLATFPDYLLFQLKKFTLRSDWVPIKLDVGVDMPWEMDLSELRGTGLKPGEVPLPDVTTEIPPPTYDEAALSQLMDIGFPPEACKRALYFTHNSGLEAASNWLMEHIADGDFDKPFVPPGTDKSQSSLPKPNESDIEMIMAMGFTRSQAEKALRATQNNVERAADWIFSHSTELDAEEAPQGQQSSNKEEFTDGNGKYRLVGFISHMGTSTQVGHYVCHILHQDRWVIFNDNKVAFSENPPKDLGYLYLYQRLS